MRCTLCCKERKSSKSGKASHNRERDNRAGTGRSGDVLDQAKDALRATPIGEAPVSLASPTGITHSVRRPRPPLPPAYPSFPTNENFFEAEPFSHVVWPENRTGSPSTERDAAITDGELENVSLKSINCDSPLDASERETFARYLPDIAPFKPISSSKQVGGTLVCNPSENSGQRVEFATEWSAFQQTGNIPAGRIENNPNFDNAKGKFIGGTKPIQDNKVNACLNSRKVQLQDCTNGDYDLYRDSCGIGTYRGDDEDFFVNHASNPQAPDSPNHHETTGHDVPQRDSSEDTIQKRSLLHPEASLAEKPDTKYQNTIKDIGRIGQETASILDIPPAEDNPTALRDYRLSLLFQDDAATTPVVPQARLARALNERDLHDLTMDDLHEEFLINKQVLASTQGEVKNYDMIAKEQQIAIEDFKVKLFADKHRLHDRLQRESEENSMLQTRLMTLQQEVCRLRSNLRSATWELTKSSKNAMKESPNEVTSRAPGRSADFSDKDSALVASLRSEISDLNEQLESSRMHSNRLLRSQGCDHSDVTRLKCQLERAVGELLVLKRTRIVQAATSDKATEELRAALAHSENALRIANKNEHLLSDELENTKASLASLEEALRFANKNEHLLSDELENTKASLASLEDALRIANKNEHLLSDELENTKASLASLEDALRFANKNEHLLSDELENTKASLASLEKSSRAYRDESVHEIRGLKQRIGTVEREAEVAQRSAHDALELCRMEADVLRSEVQRSLRALDEEKNRAHNEASERTKERLEFECKLSKSEKKEKHFAEKIKTLEECLAKSQREAIPRPFAWEDRALTFPYDGAAAEKALVEQLVASEVGRLYRGLRKKEEEESRLKAKVKQLTNKVQHAQAHAAMAKKQAACLTKEATGKSSELERDLNDLKVQLAEETAKAALTENERERLEAKLHNVINREATLEQEMISLKSRLESSEAKMSDETLRADEEKRIAVETDSELVKEIHLLKSKLRHVRKSNTAPGSMIESQREARDLSRKLAKTVSDREVLATIMADFTREALVAAYEKALTFASSQSDESIIVESTSTVPSSNSTIRNGARYPVSTGSTHFLSASCSSPQKLRVHSVVRDTMPLLTVKASPRTRGSCQFSPDLMNCESQKMNTFSPDSSCDLPPSSLSPDTRMGLPLSQVGIPSNVVEGANSSADFRNGTEDIRQTANRRQVIVQIQRRLIESTERLSAAKSKLQVLADDCDENREDQHTLKIKADKITEQGKRATDESICRQPTKLETVLCTSPDAHNTCADRVLERYRIYKASRLPMSPGKSIAVI